MKFKLVYFFTIPVLMIICINSCSEQETSVNPPPENTLINTSFEKDGKFSTEGWSLPVESDSSTMVPPDGGRYSLKLKSSQPPENFAEIKVPVLLQFNNYKLSFWSKANGITSGVFGRAVLSLVRNSTVIKSESISVSDIDWNSYSIADTFTVAEDDSFLVQLSGGMSQLFSGETYFDLCVLEAIK